MESFVQWTMQELGLFGIGLLMFLENIFPPIPSELIMPLAGYLAAKGEVNVFSVIAAGSVGAVMGILPWYVLGRAVNQKQIEAIASRHGRWLTLSPHDIEVARGRFRRHGKMSVLLGRLIPTIRTLISIPAGLARMPFWQFAFYSALGSIMWTTILATAGFGLGQAYETVKDYVDPVATTVLCGIILAYVYRVVTFKPETARRLETSG
jgi:membrane protein DedA with SNARE-associated domain